MSVTTWANGYGVWHARVPATSDAHSVARRAIQREITARESTSLNYQTRVVLAEDDFNPQPGTVVYRERLSR